MVAITEVFDVRTNPRLLTALKTAVQHKQSAEERFEQRVSYVYGLMDSKSNVTRDQVRRLIIEQEGSK